MERWTFRSERTAVRTAACGPSDTARWVVEELLPRIDPCRLLDYGTGHGRDVRYYKSEGYVAEGYDPYLRPRTLRRRYRLITCVAVLNVIPTPAERLAVLRDLGETLANDGLVVMTVRSARWHAHEVNEPWGKRTWIAHGDGHALPWPDGEAIFQRGYTRAQLDAWMDRGGFRRVGGFVPLGWAHTSAVFVRDR